MSIQLSFTLIAALLRERNISKEIGMLVAKLKHTMFYISLVSPASTFRRNNWHPNICYRIVWKTFTPIHPTLYSTLTHPKIYFNNILQSSKMAVPLNLSKKMPHIPVILSSLIHSYHNTSKIWNMKLFICHFIYFSGPNILLDISISQPSIFITPSEIKFNTIIKQNKLINSSVKREEIVHKMYELHGSRIIQMQHPFKFNTNMTGWSVLFPWTWTPPYFQTFIGSSHDFLLHLLPYKLPYWLLIVSVLYRIYILA